MHAVHGDRHWYCAALSSASIATDHAQLKSRIHHIGYVPEMDLNGEEPGYQGGLSPMATSTPGAHCRL
jgi:hypothetical protein